MFKKLKEVIKNYIKELKESMTRINQNSTFPHKNLKIKKLEIKII